MASGHSRLSAVRSGGAARREAGGDADPEGPMAGTARSINAKHKAPQPAAAGRGAASKPISKPAVAKAVKPGPAESAGIRPISPAGQAGAA